MSSDPDPDPVPARGPRPDWPAIGQAALWVGWVLLRPLAIAAPLALVLVTMLSVGRTDLQPAEIQHDPPGDFDPVGRLATSVLFQTGAIRRATPQETRSYLLDEGILEEDEEVTPEVIAGLPSWARPPRFTNHTPLTFDCEVETATAATAAVESYLRPAWRRSSEEHLARAMDTVFGLIPDLSYGLAQVRLSTFRAALAEAHGILAAELALPDAPDPTDAALFASVSGSSCGSLWAAGLILTLAGEDAATPLHERAIAYRGGRTRPAISGLLTYEALVERVARDLEQRNFGTGPAAQRLFTPVAGFDGHPFACLNSHGGTLPHVTMLAPAEDAAEGDTNYAHPADAARRAIREVMSAGGGTVHLAPRFVETLQDAYAQELQPGELARWMTGHLATLLETGLIGTDPWGGPVARQDGMPAAFDGECDVLLVSDARPDAFYTATRWGILNANRR
ncbi:hypothetical protein HKCCSP123_09365 [Rhodobacterales bacterium HKCCSP123]|nr:hypothetical protein [Rhodobacterales bacterium HKCCSP123]